MLCLFSASSLRHLALVLTSVLTCPQVTPILGTDFQPSLQIFHPDPLDSIRSPSPNTCSRYPQQIHALTITVNPLAHVFLCCRLWEAERAFSETPMQLGSHAWLNSSKQTHPRETRWHMDAASGAAWDLPLSTPPKSDCVVTAVGFLLEHSCGEVGHVSRLHHSWPCKHLSFLPP